MFPISDDNPRHLTPVVTWFIIGTCVLVFMWQSSLGSNAAQAAIYEFGMIPARVFGEAELPSTLAMIPAWSTVLTSMFMLGGWLHLGLNMLFLWIFGDNVEDSMGHVRFLIFYMICGIAAALAQALMNPESTVPMVGASGAISGVLGAYLLLHPRATVRVLFIFVIFPIVLRVPAIIMLGLWFVTQIANAAFSPITEGGVAFMAHVGGFLAGMALVPFFRQASVGLFQPPQSRPFEIERKRGPWG